MNTRTVSSIESHQKSDEKPSRRAFVNRDDASGKITDTRLFRASELRIQKFQSSKFKIKPGKFRIKSGEKYIESRSEERRVGKECRARRAPYDEKKKEKEKRKEERTDKVEEDR